MKKTLLVLLALVVITLGLSACAAVGAEEAVVQKIPTPESPSTVGEAVQSEVVQVGEVSDSGTGYEFTEPGIYTVTACLSDDGGKTVEICDSVTVIVRECIWMPAPEGRIEYVCYISNEEGRKGFVTTPEDVEKATLDYLKSIGY